jgi:hypothetical protein
VPGGLRVPVFLEVGGYLCSWRVACTCVPEAGSHDDGGVVVLLVVVVDPGHGENTGVLVGLVVLPCTPTLDSSNSDSDPDPDLTVSRQCCGSGSVGTMFLGLPDPDPLVRDMDPDPAQDLDPSIIKQK